MRESGRPFSFSCSSCSKLDTDIELKQVTYEWSMSSPRHLVTLSRWQKIIFSLSAFIFFSETTSFVINSSEAVGRYPKCLLLWFMLVGLGFSVRYSAIRTVDQNRHADALYQCRLNWTSLFVTKTENIKTTSKQSHTHAKFRTVQDKATWIRCSNTQTPV